MSIERYRYLVNYLFLSSLIYFSLNISTCVASTEPGYELSLIWGRHGLGDGQFNEPHAVAIDDDGNVYVTEWANNRVQKFSSNGTFITMWGWKGTEPGQFNEPHGIAVDSKGNIYVVEWLNHRVQKFSSNGTFITMWGSRGSAAGKFNYPHGIAVDASGFVYVTDVYNHRVQKFTSDGAFVGAWGGYGEAPWSMKYPRGIAVDSSGNIYIADTGNYRIQKFLSNGGFLFSWGNTPERHLFNSTRGVAVDIDGNVFVVDTVEATVQKFDSSGVLLSKWGSKGTGDGQFNEPCGVAVDHLGNVYITDVLNDRVQKFSQPSLRVISPNGGEKWSRGRQHNITWISQGGQIAEVKIELLCGGRVEAVLTDGISNSGCFTWVPSRDLDLGVEYSLKVSSIEFPSISDSSDTNFTAYQSAVIESISPNVNRCSVGCVQDVVIRVRWDNGSLIRSGTLSLSNAPPIHILDGIAETTATSQLVGMQSLKVTSLNCSGVREFNQTVGYIIWDRVNVTLSLVDDWLSIGDRPDIKWVAVYEYDRSPFQGEIHLDTNRDNATSTSVGRTIYTVGSIEDKMYGLTPFISNQVTCTFDRIKITDSGVTSQTSTTGKQETAWFKAVSEYSGDEFTGEQLPGGCFNRLFINESPAKWSPINRRWIFNTTLKDAGTVIFMVTGVEASESGVKAFIDEAGPQRITWEKPFLGTPIGMMFVVAVIVLIGSGVVFGFRWKRGNIS